MKTGFGKHIHVNRINDLPIMKTKRMSMGYKTVGLLTYNLL